MSPVKKAKKFKSLSPDGGSGKEPAFEDKLKKFRAVVKVGERMGEVAAHGLQIKK
jgi:hypothetical protein